MDSRPDEVASCNSGATPAVGQSTVPANLRCDQVIFTSARTPTGSGYRIIAAGGGVKPAEKQQIATRSPSHDGLCDQSPDAEGVSFYPLDGGRYCVAYTCCAGQEGTNRGGQRIYTRALILDKQALRLVDCNPFNVVRAIRRAGMSKPDLNPPPTLPPLDLPAEREPRPSELSQCVTTVGSDWLVAALQHALEARPVVVVGASAPLALVEALLLSLPSGRRAELSFGAGLRFSLGRRFLLNVVNAEPSQLRHAVQGHGVDLLETGDGRAAPAVAASPWLELARDHWTAGRWAELASFTSREFPDLSDQGLNHYARLRRRRDELHTLDVAALVDLAIEQLRDPQTDELAAELAITLTREALRCVADHLSTASVDELTRHWSDVADLWRDCELAREPLGPLVAGMLKRMTRLSPAEAATFIPFVATSLRPRAEEPAVWQAVDDLLDHLVEWTHDASPVSIEGLDRVVRNWPAQGDLAPVIERLRKDLQARMEECAARSGPPPGP